MLVIILGYLRILEDNVAYLAIPKDTRGYLFSCQYFWKLEDHNGHWTIVEKICGYSHTPEDQ